MGLGERGPCDRHGPVAAGGSEGGALPAAQGMGLSPAQSVKRPQDPRHGPSTRPEWDCLMPTIWSLGGAVLSGGISLPGFVRAATGFGCSTLRSRTILPTMSSSCAARSSIRPSLRMPWRRQHVYHLAGIAQLWVRRRPIWRSLNAVGTEKVLRAAAEHRVERVIHCSTSRSCCRNIRRRCGSMRYRAALCGYAGAIYPIEAPGRASRVGGCKQRHGRPHCQPDPADRRQRPQHDAAGGHAGHVLTGRSPGLPRLHPQFGRCARRCRRHGPFGASGEDRVERYILGGDEPDLARTARACWN